MSSTDCQTPEARIELVRCLLLDQGLTFLVGHGRIATLWQQFDE